MAKSWKSLLALFTLGPLLVCAADCKSSVEPMPDLPSPSSLRLEDFELPIREQIEQAFETARENAGDAESNGRLGLILHAYELYEVAVPCYQRAGRLSAESFKWIYYEAVARQASGDEPDAVVALLEKGVRENPDYLPARLMLAESLLNLGQLEQSRLYGEEMLRLWPNSARVQYTAGRIKSALGETAAAAQNYLRACELAPRYGSAHYALGLAYRRLGESEKAQHHLALYEANQASVPPAEDPLLDTLATLKVGASHHLNEGKRFHDKGQTEKALSEYQAALEINPRLVQAHSNLISIYGAMGEFEKAEHHYRKSTRINSNAAESHYNFGVMLLNRDRFEEAAEAFQKTLRINQFHADAYNNLGYAMQRLHRLQDAEAAYGRAIEHQPDHREAHFNLAKLLQRRGENTSAIEHFLKTLSVEDERTSAYMYYLGDAYARNGQPERAIHFARQARKRATAYSQTQLVKLIDQALAGMEQRERIQPR